MRILSLAKKNIKELLRDPLSYIFVIFLPLVLLIIFGSIMLSKDISFFKLDDFLPGISIFGFTTITLFCAIIISKNKSSALLERLSISPIKSYEYLLGYMLTFLPIVFIQNFLFFITALIMGLKNGIFVIPTILVTIPLSIFYVLAGVLIGMVFSEKAASGISSVLIVLSNVTSGAFSFEVMIENKGFDIFCKTLPFKPSVEIIKSILNNNWTQTSTESFLIFFSWTILLLAVDIMILKKHINN